MRRYIIFAISFIVFFLVFQILYGYLLTLFYTSDMAEVWNQAGNISSNGVIKGNGSSFVLLIFAFLAATIAYFTPKIFVKKL